MTKKIFNNTLADDRVKENYIFISDIHGNHETLDLIEQAKKTTHTLNSLPVVTTSMAVAA